MIFLKSVLLNGIMHNGITTAETASNAVKLMPAGEKIKLLEKINW